VKARKNTAKARKNTVMVRKNIGKKNIKTKVEKKNPENQNLTKTNLKSHLLSFSPDPQMMMKTPLAASLISLFLATTNPFPLQSFTDPLKKNPNWIQIGMKRKKNLKPQPNPKSIKE